METGQAAMCGAESGVTEATDLSEAVGAASGVREASSAAASE